MRLLGNNWTCIQLWWSASSDLPGDLEGLTACFRKRRVEWWRVFWHLSVFHVRKHTGTYTFVTRVQGVLYKTKAPFLSGRYCPCLFHSLKAMLDLLIHAASSPRSLHLSVSVSGLSPEPWKFVWYYRVAQECWRFNTLRSTPSTYEKWESADKTQAS